MGNVSSFYTLNFCSGEVLEELLSPTRLNLFVH